MDDKTKKPKPYLNIDKKKYQSHHKLIINSNNTPYEIFFPYKPYETQITYMSKVLTSLSSSSLAALESPTGTGKTLCLLCAALSFLKKSRETNAKSPIQILYTSRTHSQLTNVIKELKKTCYLPSTAVLSSRDGLCVNPELMSVSTNRGNVLNIKCKIIKKRCSFFKNNNNIMNEYNMCDIEELHKAGKNTRFCPFFFEREKMKKSDIVFLPYNYIVDSAVREALEIDMKNTIVIIDEAHNLQSVCESAESRCLSEKIIDDVNADLKGIYNIVAGGCQDVKKESVLRTLSTKDIVDEIMVLNSIKDYMQKFFVKQGDVWPDKGKLMTVQEVLDVFFKGSQIDQGEIDSELKVKKSLKGISTANIDEHLSLLMKIDDGINQEFEKNSQISEIIKILQLVKDLSSTATMTETAKSFTFFLCDNFENVTTNTYTTQKKIRTLNMFCFNPGYGFNKILSFQPHSVILTSGTLSPISGLASELKVTFPVQLENAHVVPSSQIRFSIITDSSLAKKVSFRFDNSTRKDNDMITELGNTIYRLCSVTQGGVLLFFPSYSFMNQCYSIWTSCGIIRKLNTIKEIYKDQKDAKRNKILLTEFVKSNSHLDKKKLTGGVLFSVCRGSSSEGLDFADDFARMVIVIGIPFANLGDDKVKLKKDFLDKYKYTPSERRLNGSEWYTQDAIGAVNQSLGRVIRHIYDYGAMIVIDGRYREMMRRNLFSGWLRNNATIDTVDETYINNMRTFFAEIKRTVTIKKSEEDRNKIDIVSDDSDDFMKVDNSSNSFKKIINSNTSKPLVDSYGFIIKNDDFETERKFDINNKTNFNVENDITIDKKPSVSITSFLQKKRIQYEYIEDSDGDDELIPVKKKTININKQKKPSTSILSSFDPISSSSNKMIGMSSVAKKDSDDDFISKLKALKKKADTSLISKKYQAKLDEIYPKENPPVIDLDNEEDENTTKCPICYTTSKENPSITFSISKCHHVVCDDCWNHILSTKLECPICKKKVRKQTLSPYTNQTINKN